MEYYKVRTPEGTRDRLFAECLSHRAVQSPLTSLFKRRGYSEIVTPSVEYYDLFAKSGDPLAQESMLKLIDRSGRILVMRPDCTIPIARVAATRLKGSVFPQRFYYNQTIYRAEDADSGADSEKTQCGIELMGVPGLRGDVEVIAIAADALNSLQIDGFHIELGHVGFFSALAELLDPASELFEDLRGCIETKSFAALSNMLEPYADAPAAAALKRLPYLFGSMEVLDEAVLLCSEPKALEALDYLRAVYDELEAMGLSDKIQFDLGLINRLEYYTGVVFKGYIHGAGSAVLGGGRYDNLAGYFGSELPSTGFAINVDAIAASLPPVEPKPSATLVHCPDGMMRAAFDYIDKKPGSAELSPFRELENSMALARSKGCRSVVVISSDGVEEVVV